MKQDHRQPAAISDHILEICGQARGAAHVMGTLSADHKQTMLHAMARAIREATASIIAANSLDMEAGRSRDLSDAMLDRLLLDDARIADMALGVEQVASLPDPVRRTLQTIDHPNGMTIRKTAVPLGVLAVIYESRPNVTADAASLCLRAGNAVILRGGSEALHSNQAILQALLDGGADAGLPEHAVQMITTPDRAAVHCLLQHEDGVDLVIPRGGESLIRAVAEHARVPVLKHYKGVCHVFVDQAADQQMAHDIVINAKCQRPGVCNAMETLLVHRNIADRFVPSIAGALLQQGVEIRGDAAVTKLVPQAVPADAEDWSREYLDLIANIAVVDSCDQAIDHINRFGSQHSDVIVTSDEQAAKAFCQRVDSATVYVNASSRFTDGFQFGFGAEIGISTDKLHARGPCGVNELTTYKYVICGSGQVRD